MNKFHIKLFKLQQEIGAIERDQANSYFKDHKYFDINKLIKGLKPLFLKYKLLLLQPIMDNEVCTIIQDLESEESITSGIKIQDVKDPQKVGSCVTYYRRYTLQSLLGLQADDDDGNKASGKSGVVADNYNNDNQSFI
jgi:hypothetical protein